MSAASARAPVTPGAAQRAIRPGLLAGGLALAVTVRVALNGAGAGPAFAAGGVFGLALAGLAAAGGMRGRWPRPSAIALGIAGGFVLVGLPAIARSGPGLPIGIHPEPFLIWVAVTLVVAVGEEAVLRGVMFDALTVATGVPSAIAVTSVAFALLHVPLYGWHVVPLDISVGVLLAGLRLVSGGVAAPAVAHLVADLATWWM